MRFLQVFAFRWWFFPFFKSNVKSGLFWRLNLLKKLPLEPLRWLLWATHHIGCVGTSVRTPCVQGTKLKIAVGKNQTEQNIWNLNLKKSEKCQSGLKYPSSEMKSVADFLVITKSSRPNVEDFYYKSLARREGYLVVMGVLSDAELSYIYIYTVKCTNALALQTSKLLLLGGSKKDMDLPAFSNVSAFMHSRGRKLSLLKMVWWDQHGWHLLVTSVDSWAAWGFHDQALLQLKFLILSHSGFKAIVEGKLFWIHPSLLMPHRKMSCMQWEDGNRPSKWAFQVVAKATDVDKRGEIHLLMSWKLFVPGHAPSHRSWPGATEMVWHIPLNIPQRGDCLGTLSLDAAKERSFLFWRRGDATLTVPEWSYEQRKIL